MTNEEGTRRTKACKGTGKGQEGAKQDGARMAVGMTANQFHSRLDQLRHRLVRLRHRMDTGATREGEDTPELDQVERGDIEATREGEDTPELDQVDRGNAGATREGEDTPKLDQAERGNIEA